MEAILAAADLNNPDIPLEGFWVERTEEVQRLMKLEHLFISHFNNARQACLDAVKVARPDPTGPVRANAFNLRMLEKAELGLLTAWDEMYNPFLLRIKLLHGERGDSASERSVKNTVTASLDREGRIYADTMEKVGHVKNTVQEGLQVAERPQTEEMPDLRQYLDGNRKFKSNTDLEPEKLTRAFKPDKMLEWKDAFEQWHLASNFQKAPLATQCSYFSKVVDDEIKTLLAIDKKEVARNRVYIFPDQAEEAGADVEECLWAKLDVLFDQIHPLTKIRFELFDGTKDPMETIPQLQQRLTGDVESAQLDKLNKNIGLPYSWSST